MPDVITPDYTIKQLAAELRCTPQTLYQLFHAGEFETYKVGKNTRIRAESVTAFKERNAVVFGKKVAA